MDIICPHCQQVFDMNENMSDSIREQVRTKEFKREIDRQMKLVKEASEAEIDSRVADAVLAEKERCADEIIDLKKQISELQAAASAAQLQSELDVKQAVMDTKSDYAAQIAELEYERDYYKDLKARMSTKMIGETLEQHCETEFNKIRTLAFPRAQFGKDNVVSRESGSKGDYIFREFDGDTEIISIMFEMKNEADMTASKKTNAHFFKELDKDRREKKCEYAVLVSLLESDSELYNQGIVDVSYEYPKMYVIRPQFFITIISLLRNAALGALETKKELERVRCRDVDIENFEEALSSFKSAFSYNYEQASKRFSEAISEIDKTIDHLNKVKDSLLASSKQLRLANDKADEISIRKLVSKSPSLQDNLKKGR